MIALVALVGEFPGFGVGESSRDNVLAGVNHPFDSARSYLREKERPPFEVAVAIGGDHVDIRVCRTRDDGPPGVFGKR